MLVDPRFQESSRCPPPPRSCCFFAGTQKIVAAKEKLSDIHRDPKSKLQLTAAKSLAQLGETDVIRTLYRATGSDWYMERYQANLGLKALSGRDLNDFKEATDGYDWSEGAFVSGGVEARMMLRPIEDAEQKAQRFSALAAWCRWLKDVKPELYRVLDPNSEQAERARALREAKRSSAYVPPEE